MFSSSRPSYKYISTLGLTALAIFIVFCTFLAPSANAAQGIISGTVVNVRSGAGSNYEIVGTLLKDTRVEILASSGSWNKIKYANLQGWIASEYISAAASANAVQTASRQVQVLDGPINVRSGPGATFDKLDTIADKAVFKVLGEKDGWYQIQLSDGRSAYVANWLVQEIATGTVPSKTATPVSTAVKTSANTAPSVILNQKKMQFEVAPRIENGRTLVPLRAIFEAMGANVEWNETTRTVTARSGSTTVILPLGSASPTVNGQVSQLEVAAKIVNGRTLAPLRFVGEAFGGQVNWDAQNRIINIIYTPASTPAVVIVKEAQVNLRQTPSTSAAKVDSAAQGETMTVLAAKDGWYQVKHGSVTAWVASWVVEATSETAEPTPTPVEPETPPVVNPTPPAPIPEASNEPENALHLSRSRDASGIKIMISSKMKMEPDIKQSSGSVQYEFTDRQLFGLYYFEEAVGSNQLLKVKASSQDKDTLISLDFPSDLEYKLSVEEDGKKLVVFIPNTIISIEKGAFGTVGDRFVLTTLCPVTPAGKITGDKLEVSIPNLKLKKGASYEYSSNLISSMKIEVDPSRESNLLITFNTSDMGKYSFATSGKNSDLNIILMKKVISQPREATVVLDAGHGGRDTGARGSQIDEKVVNLAVVTKAGELLKQKGIKVEYTRLDDSYVALEERSAIANRLNAALFISVHSNSTTQAAPNGTETFFYAPLENPNLYVQREERLKLATLLQNELLNKLQRNNRGVKEGNLSVLRNTQMPSALVEMAFLSNPDDQAVLMQDEFRNQAALAIVNAIEQYLSSN